MGSKSRFWLSECLLGLIWQRVFGGEVFVAKSTLGLKKQVLSLRMPTGAHLVLFGLSVTVFEPNRRLGSQSRFWLSERLLGAYVTKG